MAGLTPDELSKLTAQLAEAAKLQEKLTSGLDGYNEVLKLVRSNFRDIKNVNKEISGLDKDILKIQEKIASATGAEKDELIEKEEALKASKAILDAQYKAMLAQNKALTSQLNLTNTLESTFSSILKGGKNIAKTMWAQVGYLTEQSKAVKATELSMGVLSKQSAAFSANIFRASLTTNKLGVSAKELAEIQGRYSNEIGRAVPLTEQGLIAMTELAKGTILGTDGATQMAASMFNFNISAERTRDLVEETLNNAHSMGVDASKATKNIEKSLRLANKYHFKGGVKAALQMANAAAKTKMDMESVAGFAEKLFTPEGAIDMSAQLQVLGGEWAKLADPFALMYKARTDLKGLGDDIAKAAASTAQFNKVTGEVDISPLELHRLREVANATGLEFDNLAESARNLAKIKEVKTRITGAIDPELKDYIASTADFDEEKKQFYITLDGKTKTYVNDLHNISSANIKSQLDAQKKEKATLEQRAKQAQTWDDAWNNIVNTLKSSLLPAFDTLQGGLTGALQNFSDWMTKNKVAEKIFDAGKKIGEFALMVGKWIVDNPIKSIIAAGLLKAGQWIINGVNLGIGFNSVANAGGNGGITDMLSGGKGGKVGGKLRGMSKFGKIAGSLGTMGAGLIGDYAGGEASKAYGNEDTMTGDILSTILGIAGGIGGFALAGPAGAMIGAGAGSALGKFGGDYFSSDAKNENPTPNVPTRLNDFVMRPGEGAVPFSKNDTLVGAKPGGPIDKLLGSTNSGITPGAIEISFKPLKIEFGDLILKTDAGSAKIDILSDSKLIRDLSKMINEQLRMAIGGGKLNPNPVR